MGSMTALVTVGIWPHVRTVCLLSFERERMPGLIFGTAVGWVSFC